MKQIKLFVLVLFFLGVSIQAQTIEEYKAELGQVKGEIGVLEGKVADLQSKIDKFPGWKFGAGGLIGLDFTGSNDWVTNPSGPQTSSTSIGFNPAGFAYLDADKYFWRNDGAVLLKWLKLDDEVAANESANDLEQVSDLLKINSLFGYKLTEKIALSANAAFETPTFISDKDEVDKVAYLDLGAGATFLPIPDLSIMVHPISYRMVFAENDNQFENSAGCKIMATYGRELFKGITWNSALDGFLSYSGKKDITNTDDSITKDVGLNGMLWTNTIGLSLFKKISVGITSALRMNEQEVNAFNTNADNAQFIPDGAIDLNELQHSWLIGLGYNVTF